MMNKRYALSFAGLFLALLLLLSVAIVWMERQAESRFLDRTAPLLAEVASLSPELESPLILAMKETNTEKIGFGREILAQYGYTAGFTDTGDIAALFGIAAAFSLALTVVLFCAWAYLKKGQHIRIEGLTNYLRGINRGEYTLRPAAREDECSLLEDELYKTVVLLREGRESAQNGQERLAHNLADIAHQLKTPLSAIGLLADLLVAKLPDEDAQNAVRIATQVERLNALVSALLALSRLDAGTLELECSTIDVEELLTSAAEAVTPLLEQKRQTLALARTDANFTGDFHWSMQAVSNVLKNCCEHTPEGGQIIMSCEDNPICTEIVIEDNGSGIDPADLPHLFERFYRGKNAGKDSVGIGLALAKSLIENQNGDIRVENKTCGTKFTIKFYHTS